MSASKVLFLPVVLLAMGTEKQALSSPPAAPTKTDKPHPHVDGFGDPLPKRAVARLGTVRFRMGGLACSCAWSPDGKTLAAGSASWPSDDAITLFNAATGKPLRQLRDSQFHIASLAYSPDGRTLASGSQTFITLWEPATGVWLPAAKTRPP